MSDDNNVFELPVDPTDEEAGDVPESDETLVEVTESELQDLGAFLQQVQVVLLGHEAGLNELVDKVRNLEETVYGTTGATDESSDKGDSDGTDGSSPVAGPEIAPVPDDSDAA